jgi:putative ABC transport system permease protein
MIELILNNLIRRSGRTFLTALGVGLGVATIVALLSVSDGLTQTAAGFAHLGGADLGIFQSGVSDPTESLLPTALTAQVRRNPDVGRVTPLLLIVGKVRDDPGAFVFGMDPRGFAWRQLVFVAGGPPSGTQIAVGDSAASALHARPGSAVVLEGRRLRVSGIFHSGQTEEDTGGVLRLAAAQAIAGVGSDEVTTFAVELAPNVSSSAASASIERQFPHTLVIANPSEAARAGANSMLIHNATLVIVILALIIGAISVTNTMAMSVLERQGELALLSTIGWSDARVATLVIGEGIGVSVLGAAIGLVLGVLGSLLLVDIMGVGAFVSPSITAWGLGRGLLVGVLIGVLGGLYPAWRITRMAPLRGLARAG